MLTIQWRILRVCRAKGVEALWERRAVRVPDRMSPREGHHLVERQSLLSEVLLQLHHVEERARDVHSCIGCQRDSPVSSARRDRIVDASSTLDSIPSRKGHDVSTWDYSRAFGFNLGLGSVYDVEASDAEIHWAVFLRYVVCSRVEKHWTITALHECWTIWLWDRLRSTQG